MYKLLIVLFVCCGSTVYAQIVDTNSNFSLSGKERIIDSIVDYPEIDLDADIGSQLVPLGRIIEIAVENSPTLKFQEESIIAGQYQVDFVKRQWTQNIVANTSYFYGNQSQYTVNAGEANTGAIIGNGFRAGISVSIPLFEFVARQKRIGLNEHQLESYRYKKDELQNELSRVVVVEYAKLISNQRSLKIQSANREQAKVQLVNAEKDFKSGIIPVIEYTRIYELYTKTDLEYEFYRKEFYTSFYTFEILVGVKMTDLLKKK